MLIHTATPTILINHFAMKGRLNSSLLFDRLHSNSITSIWSLLLWWFSRRQAAEVETSRLKGHHKFVRKHQNTWCGYQIHLMLFTIHTLFMEPIKAIDFDCPALVYFRVLNKLQVSFFPEPRDAINNNKQLTR